MRTLKHAAVLSCLVLSILSSAKASEADSMQLLVKPGKTEFSWKANSGHTYYSHVDADEGGARLGMSRHSGNILMPLYRSENTEWLFAADTGMLDIDSNAKIPAGNGMSFTDVPAELYDYGVSTLFRHRFENSWMLGGYLRIGSASDEVFSGKDELTIHSLTTLRIPGGAYNAWVMMLDYDSNRIDEDWRDYPVPGIGYQFVINEKCWAMVGLPVMAFHAELTDRFSVDATAIGLDNIQSKACYKLRPGLDLYATFDIESERYMREGREDNDFGIIVREKRLGLGLSISHNENLSFSLMGGYAFGRSISESNDTDSDEERRIDLDGGLFFGLTLETRF